MNSMVEVIRSVVRRELAAVRGPALGVVTAVHSHADDGDKLNDEVDVTLQHEGVQLPRVPVVVTQPGEGLRLHVDDVVLVQFLGGDLQQAFVTGCLHTADRRPPVHADGERVVEQRVDGTPRNRIRWKTDASLVAEHLDDQGQAKVTLTLAADGSIEVSAADLGVKLTCDTLKVEGNLTVENGDVTMTKGNLALQDGTVTARHSGASTTIDGHKITGS
ncbi:MAG: hypothetical protein ACXV3A_03815 [Kineosporiaceae bacterium]